MGSLSRNSAGEELKSANTNFYINHSYDLSSQDFNMKILRKLCHECTEGTDAETRTPFIQRFACGVGHVINDIMRQLQFSFRLVFFMQVLGLSAENAGWLALQKKLALAFASPFSAFLVDRINIPFLSRKLGRRKSWHLVGTVLGVVFMPMFFSTCYACPDDSKEWQKIVSLTIFNVILALSGCLLDIGHLTLIPVIAKDQIAAVELSALRFVLRLPYNSIF